VPVLFPSLYNGSYRRTRGRSSGRAVQLRDLPVRATPGARGPRGTPLEKRRLLIGFPGTRRSVSSSGFGKKPQPGSSRLGLDRIASASKMTMREIDAEAAAARRECRKKGFRADPMAGPQGRRGSHVSAPILQEYKKVLRRPRFKLPARKGDETGMPRAPAVSAVLLTVIPASASESAIHRT